jgi:hypothetical protein
MSGLPADPVELSDCQLNWEYMLRVFSGAQSTNLLSSPTTSGLRMTFGTGSVSFAASNFSGTTTVTHNLGKTPTVVLALENTTAFGVFLTVKVISSTQFQIVGTNPTGPGTYSAVFGWVAIG